MNHRIDVERLRLAIYQDQTQEKPTWLQPWHERLNAWLHRSRHLARLGYWGLRMERPRLETA